MTEHQTPIGFSDPTTAEIAIQHLEAMQNLYLTLSATTGAAAAGLIDAGYMVDQPAVKGTLMLAGFFLGMASMASGITSVNCGREINQTEKQYEPEGATVQN